MQYLDAMISAVPRGNREQFLAHARMADAVFLEKGALRVVECWGDDVPNGKLTDLRMAVKAEAEEEVVLSWIEWPDKATRDAAWADMMDPTKLDPRMDPARNPMPFDGKRMIHGGFAPLMDLGAGDRS